VTFEVAVVYLVGCSAITRGLCTSLLPPRRAPTRRAINLDEWLRRRGYDRVAGHCPALDRVRRQVLLAFTIFFVREQR
jgi:hypothetical protein